MFIPLGAGGGRWAENEKREAEALAKLSPDEFEVAIRSAQQKKVIAVVVVVGLSLLGAVALFVVGGL